MVPYSYAQRIQHARAAVAEPDAIRMTEVAVALGATENDLLVGRIGRAFLCAWLASGFQLINVGSRLAALYAATSISPAALAEFKWPWPAFVVETEEMQVEFHARADGTVTIDVQSVSHPYTLAWCGPPEGMVAVTFQEGDSPSSESERVFAVALRIVLGCCLALTDPGTRETAERRGHRVRNKSAVEKFLPGTRYVLGNDVKLDLRPHIREYMEHGGSSPRVRTVVCGHHKWQAHGPQRALRKHIWIQPYLRGPDEGPLVIRPHVVGMKLEGAVDSSTRV